MGSDDTVRNGAPHDADAPPARADAPDAERDADVTSALDERTGEIVFPEQPDSAQWEDGPSNERIQALTDELEETRRRLLRKVADFDNYRKRMQRERQDQANFANERILRGLLPILDNLERALDAAETSPNGDGMLAEGVGMVAQQFRTLLEQFGVERIEGRGTPFDPAWHEAMQRVPSDAHPPGTVVDELEAGYRLHGRLLRAARVTVSAPATPEPPAKTSESAIPDEVCFDDGDDDDFEREDTLPNISRPCFEE